MQTRKIDKYIPYVILIVTVLFCTFLNAKFGQQVLDSDMASEMVLANLLNEEGTIISDNWYYSSELRVFNFQLLLKLGLYISPNNWHVARVIAITIMLTLHSLSFIYFLKCSGFNKKSYYLASIILFPLGLWNVFHNLFGCFYVVHSIAPLILIGTLVMAIRESNIKNITVLFVLGIIFGMNGSKVICYYSIPTLFVFFVKTIKKAITMDFDMKSLFTTKETKRLVVASISVIGTLIGFLIYVILCSKVGLVNSNEFKWTNIAIGSFLNSISSYLKLFGYPNNEFFNMQLSPLSISGIFGVFGVLMIIIIIFSIYRTITNYKDINEDERMIFDICISQIAIVIAILTLVYEANGSYFLPLIAPTLVIIEICINNIKINIKKLKNNLRLGLIIITFLASIPCLNWYINSHPRRKNDIANVASYLEDNNINKIYASFWNSNVIAELSNGKIETYTIEDFNNLKIINWLQSKKHSFDYNQETKYYVIEVDDTFDLIDYEELYRSDEYIIIKS